MQPTTKCVAQTQMFAKSRNMTYSDQYVCSDKTTKPDKIASESLIETWVGAESLKFSVGSHL